MALQNKTVLIIGLHRIRENIVSQYQAMGYGIEAVDSFDAVEGTAYNELCILPDDPDSDHDTLQALEKIATDYPATAPGQSKPLCHLLLHDKVTLWLLQTLDLYPNIHEKFELYAFTMEDQWAKNVLCGLNRNHAYPPLDREKIDTVSNKTIHLVIAGFSNLGESMAIHTALVAHFPNYERDHQLRTRITIVDENLSAWKDSFIQRYGNLFDHAYYRCIGLKQQRTTVYHEPLYHSTREDFVDVEWEFVEVNFYDPVLQRKLRLWSNDTNQLLTIALCDKNCETNFDRALALPKSVYQNQVTVFVQLRQSAVMDTIRTNEGYRNLFPIGMDDCGYDIHQPLLQMAKRLNFFYVSSFGQRGTPTEIPVDEVETEWRKLLTFRLRYSNIFNVMTVATKMRSLGHDEKNWDKFFALTKEEVEQLSAVEHNRWSVERLILGFRPPTDTEREEIKENIDAFIAAKKTGGTPPEQDLKRLYAKKQIHYDLCSFRELREDKTGQNVRLYDYDLTACIPLIAQSFNENQP